MHYYPFKLDAESQDHCNIIIPLGNTNMHSSQWVLSALPIFLKQQWKMCFQAWKMPMSTSMMQESFPPHMNTMLSCYAPFWANFVNIASLSTHSSVNGPSKKSIGSAIGYSSWLKAPEEKIETVLCMDCPCTSTELHWYSLAMLTTIKICGQAEPMYSNPLQTVWS